MLRRTSSLLTVVALLACNGTTSAAATTAEAAVGRPAPDFTLPALDGPAVTLSAHKGKAEFGLAHPILLDADGKVGRLYGAQRTPQMAVIDAAGTLVYRGGLDNTGSGRPSDANPFINYAEQALGDLRAGRPVAVPEAKPWGCSVKYGT